MSLRTLLGQERERALPLAAAHGCVLALIAVLKPVRNSLFLEGPGVAQLPYALVAAAVAGTVAVAGYGRVARSARLPGVGAASAAAIIAGLGLFRLALPGGGAATVYLFYVFVTLTGAFGTSVIWLVANAAFDARDARRLFPFVAAGGILGAVFGGTLTRSTAKTFGTFNLIFVSIGFVLLAIVLLRHVRLVELPRPLQGRRKAKASPVHTALVRHLVALTALVAILSVLTDIQFNDIVARSLWSRDARTAFFGEFFAALSVFAFVLQVVVTPRVLARGGVGAALLFLPLALAAGSLGVLLAPSLLTAILVRAGDGGFRYSIQKSATEVLFIPLPAEVKSRIKLFLDAAVDTVGTAAGALAVLFFTGLAGIPYRYLSLLSLTLIAGWLAITARIRRAYVDAFRAALLRREIDLAELRTSVAEASTLGSLTSALASGGSLQIAFALEVLTSAADLVPLSLLSPLLRHPSKEVRLNALRLLLARTDLGLVEDVEPLLGDPDPEVRLEALHLRHRQGGRSRERLEVDLAHPDPEVRSCAVGFLAVHGDADEKALVGDSVIRPLLARGGDLRVRMARALGGLPSLDRNLVALKDDPSPLVVGEVIDSVGQLTLPSLLPWLVEKLGEARYRKRARSALAAYGETAIPALAERLADPTAPRAVRVNVPRVLADIPVQASADALMRLLEAEEPLLRTPALKALNRLREKAGLSFDADRIDRTLWAVLLSYAQTLHVQDALAREPDSAPARLLRQAVEEKRTTLAEQAFRLLSLIHAPRDMVNAYHGFRSPDRALRANALEFLDNVLPRHRKAQLLPLLEKSGAARPLAARPGGMPGPEEAKGALLTDADPWLRACAAFDAPAREALVRAAREDPDPIVREAATAALLRVAESRGEHVPARARLTP